ncbi:hypothetical protein CXB51_025794 [Gossypium anomalum]|uniref:Aminotransferase-like plant mobile domain-containing protein n=1 Tax=Gossypium anomalum TaxID=47600 RepID=A0A8J6CRV2_9ROSI|nr:hypothetical protein CXB51_025794 [Gossypium anomalum]
MPNPSSPLIENYLREAGFWHVATIGRRCKLDPKLISALIERWRPETHTFHLPCGECTITLQDVHLQLGLPVDGYVVTGSASSSDWSAVCYELLGAIPDYINGELERIRYARVYILEIIGGYLIPDLSQNLVHLRWLLKLVDFRAADELSWGSAVLAKLYKEMCSATLPNKTKIGGCLSLLQSWALFRFPFLRPPVKPFGELCRNTNSLEDIRLLLDQRSDTQFEWTPYDDPAIRAVIPDENVQNPNAWYVKVPLVNYATVEMHQSDRVLRQFGFRQPIPMASEVFDEEHKVDLRLLNMDWPSYWSGYIEMWENRYDYIPTREPIIVPELACVPEYMPWFRIHGKPYLLSEERRRQIRVQRERRDPLNPRRRDDDAGPSIAPTQSAGPSTAPKISKLVNSAATITGPNSSTDDTHITAFFKFYARYVSYPLCAVVAWGIAGDAIGGLFFLPILITLRGSTSPPWVMQTPPQSLFYQGGSSSQHPQSDPLSDEPQPSPEAEPRRNPARTHRRPLCGIDSDRH